MNSDKSRNDLFIQKYAKLRRHTMNISLCLHISMSMNDSKLAGGHWHR